MSKLRIPGVSAVLEPSTARTAATPLAGFLEGGAHGTSVAADSGSAHHRSSRRGRCNEHVEIVINMRTSIVHDEET